MTTITRFRVVLLVLGFALGGLAVVARATLNEQYLSLGDRLLMTLWWPGAVGGALVANAGWLLSRSTTRRAALLLIAVNLAAWGVYLTLTPRLTAAEISDLEELRHRLESNDGISFIEDGPSMLAGRRHGFWTFDTPHLVLKLFASPALDYGEYVVLLPRFSPPPRLDESYAIAALALLWSSAFWATASSWIAQGVHLVAAACRRR